MVSRRLNPATRPRRRSGAFHSGSFAAGIVLGVAVTLMASLVPDLVESEPGDAKVEGTSPQPAAPKFEFFESLPKTRVSTDTAPYASATPVRPSEAVEYLLQAGSFANKEDAERLRVRVADLGLDAVTSPALLADGAQRHRVVVGPYSEDREMRRALSLLREQKIDPLLLARKPTAG